MALEAARRGVFLSASVTDPRRHPKYFQTARANLIREAVVALAAEVLPQGELVFGGHPSISPLVARVAGDLGRFEGVVVFQSLWFHPTEGKDPKSRVPADSLAFPRITWTPLADSREGSLEAMRRAMVGSRPFACGVFVGGMEGVEREWELFGDAQARAPAYAVASTGGVALELWEKRSKLDPALAGRLRGDLVYQDLFRSLLERTHGR